MYVCCERQTLISQNGFFLHIWHTQSHYTINMYMYVYIVVVMPGVIKLCVQVSLQGKIKVYFSPFVTSYPNEFIFKTKTKG